MFAAVGWIAMAGALFGVCYALASAYAIGRFFKTPSGAATSFPAVTILKPLHLAEPDLARNLDSFCTQDYPSAVQLVFGVASANDSAIATVKALKAKHPELDITLVIGTHRAATNPKISNLIEMFPSAKHDTLVLSDSDIHVPADYLRTVVAALEPSGTGAVTCCYRGAASGSFWSKMAAMGIDYQFFPGVVFGVSIGLAKPCLGSTIALKKSGLAEIGGFEAFADKLADDYESGRALRARRYSVVLVPLIVSHTCAEQSAGELFRHELRWARTIASIDAAGYAGSIFTHMVPLALVGVLFLGASYPTLLMLLAALAGRQVMKHEIDRGLGGLGQSAWLLPLRDMLSFAVFLGSFFARRVDWQGRPYQVKAGGALVRD